jgi:hypothetical protein
MKTVDIDLRRSSSGFLFPPILLQVELFGESAPLLSPFPSRGAWQTVCIVKG